MVAARRDGTISESDTSAGRIPSRVRAVLVTDAALLVDFEDGRLLTVPLAWYPRLAYGTEEERGEVGISDFGLYWPLLDEDISVAALLDGQPSPEGAGSLARWKGKLETRRQATLDGTDPDEAVPWAPLLPLPDSLGAA